MAPNQSELPSPVASTDSLTGNIPQHLPAATTAEADNDHLTNKSAPYPAADHSQDSSASRAARNLEPFDSSTQLSQGQLLIHNSGSDDISGNSATIQKTNQEPAVSSSTKPHRSSTQKQDERDFYDDAYRKRADVNSGADRIQWATAANTRADIAGDNERMNIRFIQDRHAPHAQPVDVVNRLGVQYRVDSDAVLPSLRPVPFYGVNDRVRHLSRAEEADDFGSKEEFSASRGGGRKSGTSRYHNTAVHGTYSVPVGQNDWLDDYAPQYDNFDDYRPYRGGQNSLSPQPGTFQNTPQQDSHHGHVSQRPRFEIQPRHYDGCASSHGEERNERSSHTVEAPHQHGRFNENPEGFGSYGQSSSSKNMHRGRSIEAEPRDRRPFDENPVGFASRMLPLKSNKSMKAAVDLIDDSDADNNALEWDERQMELLDGGDDENAEYQPKAKTPKRGRGQARGRGSKAGRAGRASARGAKLAAAGRGRVKKPLVLDIAPDAPIRPNLKPMTQLTAPFSTEDFTNLAFRDEEDNIDPEPMQAQKRRRVDDDGQHEVRPVSQRPPRTVHEEEFNDPGAMLPESRYQGGDQPWNLNQDPPLVPASEVSNAALLKRDLKRPRTEFVCKRSYGANDPENIAIVNLREYDGKDFTQICAEMNDRRIEAGKAPTLSVTGVTARYNRTAPLLFAARGEEFIPLAKRPFKNAPNMGKKTGFAWTSELDVELVNIFKEVDSERWKIVADIFRERTGEDVDYMTVARRYSQL